MSHERHVDSNHLQLQYLLNSLFRGTTKKHKSSPLLAICEGNRVTRGQWYRKSFFAMTSSYAAMYVEQVQNVWKRTGPRINIKTVFPDVVISVITIRWSWDRLIFIMGSLYWQEGSFILGRPSGTFVNILHHGSLVRYVKLRVRMRRECRERFSLSSGFRWSRRRWKTFPVFPAHTQSAILRIWQEAHLQLFTTQEYHGT